MKEQIPTTENIPESIIDQKYKALQEASNKHDQVLDKYNHLQEKIDNISATALDKEKAGDKIFEEIIPLMDKVVEEVRQAYDKFYKAYEEWNNAINEKFGEKNEG